MSSDGAWLREAQACLDCLITKNRPVMGLQRAGRFIHYIQSEYPYIKVKKVWTYLYRAVDSQGNTLEFLLTPTRDASLG